MHWKDWFCSRSSNTFTRYKEPTHWKSPWCWERLKAGGERDDRGWDGWMASSTQWAWVWASSGSWWWIAKPGVLQSMGSQRVRHDGANERNWRKRRATVRVTAETRWACSIHMASTTEGPPWASPGAICMGYKEDWTERLPSSSSWTYIITFEKSK